MIWIADTIRFPPELAWPLQDTGGRYGTMFGWKRKTDGFEWHEHIRTTIMVRRNDRRRRIENIRADAAEQVRNAGKAGVAARQKSAIGLQRGYYIARYAIGWAGLWVAHMARKAAYWLGSRSRAAGQVAWISAGRAARSGIRSGGAGWRVLVSFLRRPNVSAMLLGATITASAFTTVCYLISGVELETQLGLGLTFVLTVMTLISAPRWPQLAAAVSRMTFPSLPPSTSAVFGAIRSRLLPRSVGRRAGWIAASLVAVVGAGWAGHTLWSSAPDLGSLSVMQIVSAPQDEPVQGYARAISGDTLSISGRNVRLANIEAPELIQACRSARGRAYRCGRRARRQLSRLVSGKRLSCQVQSAAAQEIMVGTCRYGDTDIAAAMVAAGHAFATGGLLSSPYATEENTARAQKIGVWQGDTERPEAYRAKKWARAKARAPQGCPIKGRVIRKRKVYLLPWSPRYRRTRVRSHRGERWFCSEEDALAAGWRPATAG